MSGFCACGLSAASAAPRCRACPQVDATPQPYAPVRTAAEPATSALPLMTYSRWQKSDGTFGPTGRIVATLLALLPLPILAMAAASGIGIIGAGIYLVVILPWALRDIWKKAAIPVQPVDRPRLPRF